MSDRAQEIAERVIGERAQVDMSGQRLTVQSLAEMLRAEIQRARDEAERAFRTALWMGHGHTAQYGDDGEMQCAMCLTWDYRRAEPGPLVAAVLEVVREQERVRLRALVEQCREALGKWHRADAEFCTHTQESWSEFCRGRYEDTSAAIAAADKELGR